MHRMEKLKGSCWVISSTGLNQKADRKAWTNSITMVEQAVGSMCVSTQIKAAIRLLIACNLQMRFNNINSEDTSEL